MASNTSKVASNTIYQLAGRLVSAIETLIVAYVLTRALGPSKFGQLTLIITFITTFFVMADFGINTIVVRQWSIQRLRLRKELSELLVLRFLLSLILGLIALVIVYILSLFSPQYNELVIYSIAIGAILIIGQGFYLSATAVFQTYFSYAKSFWANLWGNIAALILVFSALYFFGADVFPVYVAIVIGGFIPSLIALYYIRQYIDVKCLRIDIAYFKKILGASFPTGLGLILNTLLTSADRFLLSILSTAFSLGLYGLAYRVFENILVLPNFLLNASFPILVRHRETSPEKLNGSVQKLFDSLALIAFPLVINGVILAPIFIKILGGGDFEGAGPVLTLLFLGTIFYFFSPLFRWLVIVAKKERLLPLVYGVGLALNVGLNLYLIPKWGVLGAAVTNAVSEFVILTICAYISLKFLKLRLNLKMFLVSLVSSLFMIPFVFLFKDWYLIGPIILGGAVYFLALFGLTRGKIVDVLPAPIRRFF